MAGASSSFSCGGALLVLFFILFVVVSGTKVTANDGPDPLLPVCKTVGGGSTFFDVEFCQSALGSDDRSRNAERYRDFSAIAVDLVTANATSTAAKINGLLIRDTGAGGGMNDDAVAGAAPMKQCLRSCQALYGGILQRQPGCAAAVKGGRFGDATASLEKSAAAAKECEAGFGRNKVASPVTVEDDSAFKLAKLAVALLRFSN